MANNTVYEMVTDRIIAKLEEGKIPWNQPWINIYGENTMEGAFNRITKKSYSMLNQMLLEKEGEYATFKQWSDLGGKIRKGAKSEIVVFWKILVKETEIDGEIIEEKIPMLRYYRVFHIDDVEGVKPLPRPEKVTINNSDAEGDKIILDYVTREGIDYREQKSNEAFYMPSQDRVVVPERSQFKDGNKFYSTTFHELVHSTGNAKRLNRLDRKAAFGSENYSKEELVAEIGAASMLNLLGMETENTFDNSAAYIQSWIKALKDDVRMIVSAASRAEKAVEYILGDDYKPHDTDDITESTESTTQGKDNAETVEDHSSTETVGKKKTRKQSRKVIIKRIVSDAIGNNVYAEHTESDAGKPSMFNYNGKDYYGFIDGHRIIATTKDYGYGKAENPFRINQFINDKNAGKLNNANEWFKVMLDREKVIEKKRENRKESDKKPYIVEIPFDSKDTKYLGINPSFAIDAMDFVGVDYCYLAFDEEAWSAGTTYKTGVFFVNDNDTEMENICMVLPINILGKYNKPDQIGIYQMEE